MCSIVKYDFLEFHQIIRKSSTNYIYFFFILSSTDYYVIFSTRRLFGDLEISYVEKRLLKIMQNVRRMIYAFQRKIRLC